MSDERASEIIDLNSRRREQIERVRELNAGPAPPPLQGGGGGGTFDGMEPRVARLEADVEHIKTDVGDIKSDVRSLNVLMTEARTNIAVLTERVGVLPTKAYIGAVVVGGVAFGVALLTLLSRMGWLVAGTPTH